MNAFGLAVLVAVISAVISAVLTALLGVAATSSGAWRQGSASAAKKVVRRTGSAETPAPGALRNGLRDCPLRGSGRCGSGAATRVTSDREASAWEAPESAYRPEQDRCAQAVRRAAHAVDTLSTTTARHALHTVVRRMEAELPHVRALVELERSLRADSVDAVAAERVRYQLVEASERFHVLAEHIVDVLMRYVAVPDIDQLHTEVTLLRGQFPLLRPMSDVLGRPVPAEVPA